MSGTFAGDTVPEVFTRLKLRALARVQRSSLLAAAAAQQSGAVPDLTGTVEVETTFARLLLDEDDQVVTPALVATSGWEPGETALLGARIKPAMTVLDIGAHVGYFTCLAARLAGPRGLVVALEPNPRNFDLLTANVWRNGFTNVVCFPWAAGTENGFADLFISPTNGGDHRLFPLDEPREAVRVRVATLDAVEALRPPVDIVKIDVQGAEEGVMRGMQSLLSASPDVLVTLEFWPAGARQFGSSPESLLDFYRSLGFGVRVQMPDEKGLLDLTDSEILAYCARGDGEGHVNLVLERLRR